MKIAIFCSANNNIAPEYFEQTEALGRWIAENGHSIVYGGCNSGLMECIGKTVHEAGGQTIGVIPRMVEQGGRESDYVDVSIPCDNLSDRKDLMLLQADVAIALPGGIGTLDEVMSMAASHSIGYHSKMVVLYNINGFWDKLIALLDDFQAHKMIRGQWTDIIQVASNLDEMVEKLRSLEE